MISLFNVNKSTHTGTYHTIIMQLSKCNNFDLSLKLVNRLVRFDFFFNLTNRNIQILISN